MQFRPDESAADDMLALEAVRTWEWEKQEEWKRILRQSREADGAIDLSEMWFRPGDWSAAALAVIEEREGKA